MENLWWILAIVAVYFLLTFRRRGAGWRSGGSGVQSQSESRRASRESDPPARLMTQSRNGHREDFTPYCPMCGRDAVPEIRREEQGFCSEEHAEAYLAEIRERAARGKGA